MLLQALLILQNMSFPDRAFKPVQRGFKLSTNTLMSLHNELVVNGPLDYLMSGRLTQDALENLFSQVIAWLKVEYVKIICEKFLAGERVWKYSPNTCAF